MITRSATPSASAPPDEPSPITTATAGTRRRSIVCMLRAIAPPWPRSSAPPPGNAPGRVDERDDRQVELVGERHHPHGLAVALGPGHAEVAVGALGRVAALLVADDRHRAAVAAPDARDDRRVVAVEAVAVQLLEVRPEARDVVERVGAVLVAGELDRLPDRRAGLGLAREPVGEAAHEAAPAAGGDAHGSSLVLARGGPRASPWPPGAATGRAGSWRPRPPSRRARVAQVTAGGGSRPVGRSRMRQHLGDARRSGRAGRRPRRPAPWRAGSRRGRSRRAAPRGWSAR